METHQYGNFKLLVKQKLHCRGFKASFSSYNCYMQYAIPCLFYFMIVMYFFFLLSSFLGYFKAIKDLRLKTSSVTTPNSQMAASTSVDDNPHLSHCNREYAEYLQVEEEEEEEEAATCDKPFGQSHFECTIGRYFLSKRTLFLPQQFAIANGLINKKCWLIVRDKRQRSWNLKINNSNNTRARAYIGGGWRKFITENCLKEGDHIIFKVVTNGETPIWKFQVLTNGETPMKKFQEKPSPSIKLSNKTSSHEEAATNKPCVQSHFECTIRQYCLSRGLLCLPKQFASTNGLINKMCDLIIRDERQRSWNLKLRYWEPGVYIKDGWRKFIADNCLKKGDRIMFEVVTNGETPIWKFQVVSEAETPLQKYQDIIKKPSNMSPLNAQVSTSTSGDDDHPYFISTIKPYCISRTEFSLPLDFAKSNGLINRKCEMILKDEAQRCWSVWLGRIGNGVGIIRGWTKFRAENGLQVGDAYKFELIKNGEIPIAHFHCKYSAKVAKREKQ
ncbi:hypothetical protein RND71_004765 [Anisodus tanguticus]|uniref:TF-B3 domain-containing protein n=1 Tax=Anisodus tanguticus TaxID=243964 RepID=A0AAE1SR55_9SOLA|nr:hypothetical protein RND71_004765 [Anisodus tanguticus]